MKKSVPSDLDPKHCNDLIKAVTSGTVLFPSNPNFEKARTSVWNLDSAGMPIVIVQCLTSSDVAAAINFAKQVQHRICVHSAGAHSNQAVVDDAVVIDLSLLRTCEVDIDSNTVTVQGGATIGDVDAVCKPFGVALPMGHVHHTGVAGMCLNATSGLGYLSRTRKMTVSYLRSVTLVMSDGTVKKVNENEDPELMWAVKGAGSNFGIAIEMVFSLTKVAPTIFAGDLIKFGKDTGPGSIFCLRPLLNSDKTRKELVMNWFDFFVNANVPDECSSLLVITPQTGPIVTRTAYLPREEDADAPPKTIEMKAREAFEPLTSYGYTLSNGTKMMDYWDGLQKIEKFDPSYFYQKAATLTDIPRDKLDGIMGKLCDVAENCPISNRGTGIILQPLGGELSKLDLNSCPSAKVYATKLKWWIIIVVQYPKGKRDPDLREKCITWCKECHKIIEEYATKDNGRVEDYWSTHYGDIYSADSIPRLRALKKKYDPDNVFSLNRNILPA